MIWTSVLLGICRVAWHRVKLSLYLESWISHHGNVYPCLQ